MLIVGAGASGAAVAWSLAETRMRIVCLEQGGWMNPAEYPSTGRDWETRAGEGDAGPSPNVSASAPADYPINDGESPIAIVNFNGVGGSTILYSAHFPRFHPSDFRVKSLNGVADDWPIDYSTLEPFFAENDSNIGVVGTHGRPAIPTHQPPLPHIPMGRMGETMGRGFNEARLALVAVRQRHHHPAPQRPRQVSEPRPVQQPAAPRARRAAPTSPTGR